jgi:hypothetical protein
VGEYKCCRKETFILCWCHDEGLKKCWHSRRTHYGYSEGSPWQPCGRAMLHLLPIAMLKGQPILLRARHWICSEEQNEVCPCVTTISLNESEWMGRLAAEMRGWLVSVVARAGRAERGKKTLGPATL